MKAMGRVLLVATAVVAFSGFGQLALGAEPAKESDEMTAPAAQRQAYDPKKSFERFSQKLNLTDEQKEKIRPILNDEVQSMRKLHQETMEKQIKMIEDSSAKVNTLLTPEQQKKFKEMREDRLKRCRKDMGWYEKRHQEMLEYDMPESMKVPDKE